MARSGNPASASDAGVAALCARTAVMGAYLNVQINTGQLEDKSTVKRFISEGLAIQTEAQEREARILAIVQKKF